MPTPHHCLTQATQASEEVDPEINTMSEMVKFGDSSNIYGPVKLNIFLILSQSYYYIVPFCLDNIMLIINYLGPG